MDMVCLEEYQGLQPLADRKRNFNSWVGIIVLVVEGAWVEYISSVYKMYCIFKQLLHWQDGYHTGKKSAEFILSISESQVQTIMKRLRYLGVCSLTVSYQSSGDHNLFFWCIS